MGMRWFGLRWPSPGQDESSVGTGEGWYQRTEVRDKSAHRGA